MEEHAQSRTESLIGAPALQCLRNSAVAVLGIGGVGSYAVEALARAGVGRLFLVDADDISVSNINRQIHATTRTVGEPKVEAMARRVREIDPEIVVDTRKCWITAEGLEELLFGSFDYIVDAVDTVTVKIALASYCHEHKISLISSMGAGNKLDPTAFVVDDIFKTRHCPLARVLRRELKKRGVPALKVVYSEEKPLHPCAEIREEGGGEERPQKRIPASISFVPSVAGLILAGEVIRDLIGIPARGKA